MALSCEAKRSCLLPVVVILWDVCLCVLSVPLLEILKDTLRSLAEGRIGHRVVSFRVVQ